ncbi:MAG TPA: hypothetical protein VIJ64_13365 [Candidatus Lustribacter sp.]
MPNSTAAPVSIAALLDDIRPLIARARDHGEQPRFLLLAGDSFDAVRSVKAADAARGMPLMVLGMQIVRGDDPATAPKVF